MPFSPRAARSTGPSAPTGEPVAPPPAPSPGSDRGRRPRRSRRPVRLNFRVGEHESSVWLRRFGVALKAIAESFCYSPIPQLSIDRIRCGITQISVEDTAISTVTQLFGQSMNTCRRVTILPFFRWRVNARKTDDTMYRLSANGHRDRFSTSIPQPQLSGCHPSIDTEFGIVGRLTNFLLESTGPQNH